MAKTIASDGIDIRDHILSITSRLIEQKGIENTSLADIAKEANISKGTLYYHFASKSDLIFEITENYFTLITERLMAWVAESKDTHEMNTILLRVFQTVVGAQARTAMHIYLIQEAISTNPKLKHQFTMVYKSWEKMLLEGLELANPHHPQNIAVADMLLALLDGHVVRSLVVQKKPDYEKTVQAILKIYQ